MLCETFRPRTLDDVAGQRKAVDAVRRVLARNWGGRAWLIQGPSGCGKTTVGKLIAAAGANDFAVLECDSGSLTPARVREIEQGYQCGALPVKDDKRSGRCIVVNECHACRADTVTALLDILERLPAHVVWVFTTKSETFGERRDEKPLISRCTRLVLADDANSRKERALWVRKCAVDAGVDGFSELVYVVGMDAVDGNTRELFQLVDSGQLADVAVDALTAKLRALPLDGRHGEQRAELQRQIADLTRSQ